MYLLRALLFLYLFLDFFLAGRSAVRVPGTGLLELVGWFHFASRALENWGLGICLLIWLTPRATMEEFGASALPGMARRFLASF